MGQITSGIGLVTGVPIDQTVDQLIALEAVPRDRLVARTEQLQAQQVAITELTARVLGVQFSASQLALKESFQKVTISSSNPAALSAIADTAESPAPGQYRFTPIQTAQAQQALSSGFTSRSDPLGAGVFTLGYDRPVDEGVALDLLNDGRGFQRGRIRITDRSGASAEIDLRFALTIDDVLDAINRSDQINITAEARGDRIRLVDHTSQSVANLRVQEVGAGRTASDLGLSDIDVAAGEALGRDVLGLYDRVTLESLNDGRGVETFEALAELALHLRDGTRLVVDFDLKAVESDFATAATDAETVDARLRFTAVEQGDEFDDVTIVFQDNPAVTVGNETVRFIDEEGNKQLVFDIDAGNTSAEDVRDALARNTTISAIFTAELVGDGSGAIELTDTAVTAGGGGTEARHETTLGEILETINAVDPAKLQAEIGPDGDRLVLTDLTSGSEVFSAESLFGLSTAEGLGLVGEAVDGVLTGKRLLGGLKTSLIDSLGGRDGLATLGLVRLTDRGSATAAVDLSAAETLDDVLIAINGADIGITAAVNAARNGITLTDTTGATSGNLIVADGADAKLTATTLGIVVDEATESVDGGDLRRRAVARSTRLADLNGGLGVGAGQFRIFDSNGASNSVNVDLEELDTVGDLIGLINGLSVSVAAKINDEGNGILLYDTGGGPSAINVISVSGTAARDLHLEGGVTQAEVNGVRRSVINGSSRVRVELDEDDTLADMVLKINDLGLGVNASILDDGSTTAPYRVSLVGSRTGKSATLRFDTSQVGFSIEETVAARDALLLVGSVETAAAAVLATSSDNQFDDLIAGMSITVNSSTEETVVLNVNRSSGTIVTQVQQLVDAYNTLRETLVGHTSFDENSFATGLLFGSNEALRVDTEMSRFFSGRFFGVGEIQSFAEVGLDLKDDGTIEFDAVKLQRRFAEDPDAVTEFFTTEEIGAAAKLDALLESMAARDGSLLVNRAVAIGLKIETNIDRVKFLDDRLERSRERLFLRFVRMELAIGKLQGDLAAVTSLQPLPPLGGSTQ